MSEVAPNPIESSVLEHPYVSNLQHKLDKLQASFEEEKGLFESDRKNFEFEIARLKHRLAILSGEKFAQMRERFLSDPNNVALPLEFGELPAVESVKEVHVEVPAHSRVKKGRKPLPENLPREIIDIYPEQKTCGSCDKELSLLGFEVTEILEREPAKLTIKEYRKHKKACSCCKAAVVQGVLPAGAQPVDGSRVGPSLLAYLLTSKYVDHLPLFRLEKMLARDGFEVPRQRMCDWFEAAAEIHLVPVYLLLKAALLKSPYVQLDETKVRVQDPELKGRCHNGWFWAGHSPPDKIAVFQYNESRSGEAGETFFGDYKGHVQCDDYAVYHGFDKRIACMAHIRRYFFKAEATDRARVANVLELIRKLYKLEDDWRLFSNDARKTARLEHSLPVLNVLHELIAHYSETVLPRAELAEACSYALNNWKPMLRYLDNGMFHIDNNAMEREIRPIAIGRKNWLFAGSHEGAQRAAVFYSIAATCKLNRVNPYKWLKAYFSAGGATHIKAEEIHKWLPNNLQVKI